MITPINNSTPLGIRLPKTKELSSDDERTIEKRCIPTTLKNPGLNRPGIAHHYSLIPVHHFIATAFDAFFVMEVCFTAVRRLAAS